MSRYIVRRILTGLLTLVLVVALTFVLFYLLPSADPAVLRAGRNPSPSVVAAIRHSLGTDRPIYIQFWTYVKQLVLHFDLGFSYQSSAPVNSLIKDRLPATLSLTIGGALVWMLIGIPVGIISAVRRRSKLDRVSMGASLVLVSAPTYWLGLVVLFLFASDIGRFHVFPDRYVGLTSDPVAWFEALLMPWGVLAASAAAIYARLLRSSLVETMSEDYIRTARAKGLTERRVVLRHGVRSAITPIVTVLGLDIGTLLGGTVLVETVFNIPGIGRLNYDAITHADFPIIQGTVLLAALFIVVANIIVDISYAFLDPRVRYS